MLSQAKLGDPPSRRESQVAIAMLFGRSSKQTAHDLRINYRTVNTYRERLYIKFGVHNTVDLVRVLMSGAAG